MKRLLFATVSLFIVCGAIAQNIKFSIVDGIQDHTIKGRIERGISKLLNEINSACAQERPLRLDQMDMALSGKRSLQALWKNIQFMCEDNQIVERCLTSAEGYVIRNIYTKVKKNQLFMVIEMMLTNG